MPSSISPTKGAATSPTTVATVVPGDSAVPIDRNQSAPSRTMRGTWASVSTLFTSVGLGWPFGPTAGASTDCQPVCTSVANRPCS